MLKGVKALSCLGEGEGLRRRGREVWERTEGGGERERETEREIHREKERERYAQRERERQSQSLRERGKTEERGGVGNKMCPSSNFPV